MDDGFYATVSRMLMLFSKAPKPPYKRAWIAFAYYDSIFAVFEDHRRRTEMERAQWDV
ncbi:hypothetical protein ZHAS_00009264 [Anopheles sinensis]|uniref:Uncharacterized protein n=1 Tax=Anopheles sinensis TaxID=74873 RepID=A0A084VUJ6_ANOSI|nr:hypothetical protein ZHAS_00009264 [Anopheles sinensis]